MGQKKYIEMMMGASRSTPPVVKEYMFEGTDVSGASFYIGFDTEVEAREWLKTSKSNTKTLKVKGKFTGSASIGSIQDGLFSKRISLTDCDLSECDFSEMTDLNGLLYGNTSLVNLTMPSIQSDTLTSCEQMYTSCSKLISINIDIHAPNLITLNDMFSTCTSATSITVSGNISNVNDVSSMFYSCTSLISVNVSSLNSSKITTAHSLFRGCTKLTTVYGIYPSSMTNVADISYMYYNCSAYLPPTNFGGTKIVLATYAFYGCTRLSGTVRFGSSITNMTNATYMFANCTNITTIDFRYVNFTNAITYNLRYIVQNCSKVTSAIARTASDATKLNSTLGKPSNINFTAV